jgi:NAD(P)-dependent dehydrogenase (short-subunit alcohol dehydrogenase family)
VRIFRHPCGNTEKPDPVALWDECRYQWFSMTTESTNLEGKVCVVTGSNTGIGKETARGLLARGATVVLACRDIAKAEAASAELSASAKGRVRAMPMDLASFASIRSFASAFRAEHKQLDILVNNAGVWTTERTTTKQGFETTFGVNHLGTFLLTQELLPLVHTAPAGRIVVLSSALHYRGNLVWEDLHFEKRKYNGPVAYNQSKLANVLFTNALARRLSETPGNRVTVNAVHPGVVATELARDYPPFLIKIFHLFLLSPAEGAACSLHVATSPDVAGVSGAYFEKSKAKKASDKALDVDAQERLWTLTEKLIAEAKD